MKKHRVSAPLTTRTITRSAFGAFMAVLSYAGCGASSTGGLGASVSGAPFLTLEWRPVGGTGTDRANLADIHIEAIEHGRSLGTWSFAPSSQAEVLDLPVGVQFDLVVEALSKDGIPRFRGRLDDVLIQSDDAADLGVVDLYPLERDRTLRIRRAGELRVRVEVPSLAMAAGLMEPASPFDLMVTCIATANTGWSYGEPQNFCLPFDPRQAAVVFDGVALGPNGNLRAGFFSMVRDRAKEQWLALWTFASDPPGFITEDAYGTEVTIAWEDIPDE